MILIGNNLGERHRYLNSKVTEAVANKKNFEELKSQPETCNVDKLFKIDIASKYKNIDYILEVLKGGDVFYMTRALKCLWLYSDDYAHIINIDYLQANVFPYMSRKMKRKTLTAVSVHMRNADRHVQFYQYCLDAKLDHYANKFQVLTPDSFKLNLLKTWKVNRFNNIKLFKQFIGKSYELANAYLCSNCSWDQYEYTLHELRFLYFASAEEYLNILESYARNTLRHPKCSFPLNIKISKDICKKHKDRILKNPLLYVNKLNQSVLQKHVTNEDIDILAYGLLPDSPDSFWSLDFYNTYKFILAKLPTDKLYGYIKQIYTTQYKTAHFEMRIEFYNLKYYELLTIDEREEWALQHIERDKELPGIKNYMWYKFVSYRKAVSGIKQYIFLTPDRHERSQIINLLPETIRNEDDINGVLCYYYSRHVNETEDDKASFLNAIIALHDIFSFNDECWTSFNRLLYSLDVYTSAPNIRPEFKFISLVYHIIHDIALPQSLQEYIEDVIGYYKYEYIICKLSEENKIKVSKYLLDIFAAKIKSLIDHPDYVHDKVDDPWNSDPIKNKIQEEIHKIWCVINSFNRPHEDCPEIGLQYMESNKKDYQYHEKYKEKFIQHSEEDFVRWLKQDVNKAIDGICKIRRNTYRWNFRLSRLFRKLKVYFSHDVGKEYLNYFTDYLFNLPEGYREYRNVKMAVVGVYYLGDPETIACMLENYVPINPKIDRMEIDNRIFQVQKAICRLAYHSRPPIPLCNIQKYIAGDYVHFCLPTIYNYFDNLQSIDQFIASLLDAPLSIQKHGLRLAVICYNAGTLKPILISAWKKTKNVSLRMLLFQTLFKRILQENKSGQKKLFEVLKLYTSELNHDDHDNVYALLVSDHLPNEFKGDFIETAWLTVCKLSEKSTDMNRKLSVIHHLEEYIHLIRRNFLRLQIIDDHVDNMLRKKHIIGNDDDYYVTEMNNDKWDIIAIYIVSLIDESEHKKSLELMNTIMVECLESWNLVKSNTYTVRKFLHTFIQNIMDKDPKSVESCANMINIYQCILDNLRSYLRKDQIYLLNWELRLSIICRKIIIGNQRCDSGEIAVAYGKKVGKIIINCIKNDELYRCFYQSIVDIVKNTIHTICDIIGEDEYNFGFIYYVCDTLIDIKMTETHLLALMMLPQDENRYCTERHCEIIANIKRQCVSQEVRTLLFSKYVLSDYKVRGYVV